MLKADVNGGRELTYLTGGHVNLDNLGNNIAICTRDARDCDSSETPVKVDNATND